MACHGYGTLVSASSAIRRSHVSAADTMPSGRYALACQMASISSRSRPAKSMSFASLSGMFQTLHFPGENNGAHFSAAFFPGSSMSNARTTDSNRSSHSRDALRSLCAPCAPLLIDTTGHLFPWIWLMVMQSISPSVTTTIFPLSRQSCCPKSSAFFTSPAQMKSLFGNRTCCATRWPLSS